MIANSNIMRSLNNMSLLSQNEHMIVKMRFHIVSNHEDVVCIVLFIGVVVIEGVGVVVVYGAFCFL